MNTTTKHANLTAADLESLDIEELLRSIFASDVDLKDLLNKGIEQVKHTEAIAKKAHKAEVKAAKRAAREEKRVENAEVNFHLTRVGVNGALVVAAGGCAVLLTNPIGYGLLAGTATIRVARYTRDYLGARRDRDALRNGDVVEVSDEQALRSVMGDSRFEAILGLADAGVMAQIGLVGKDPVWLVLSALNLIMAGYHGAVAVGAGAKLVGDAEAIVPPAAVPVRKPGAHKAAPSLVTV